jgi:hypothetical protein
MSNELYAEYNAAIGSLVAAGKQFTEFPRFFAKLASSGDFCYSKDSKWTVLMTGSIVTGPIQRYARSPV